MPSGEENTNHDVLYSAPHPLRPHRIDSSVLLLDDSLTVRCKDRRSGKVWGQRVSVAVVSALAQNYYYNLRMLWDLLCRSMVFTGGGVHFSTQHIIHFPLCRSSHGVDSYRIYERTKKVEDGDPWHVQFISECAYPFHLELAVRRLRTQTVRYAYRIESALLMDSFQHWCLDLYRGRTFEDDRKSEFDKEPNHMLDALLEDLIYDEESDSFMVKFIEVVKLETFYEQSCNRNRHAERKLQRRIFLNQKSTRSVDVINVNDGEMDRTVNEGVDNGEDEDDIYEDDYYASQGRRKQKRLQTTDVTIADPSSTAQQAAASMAATHYPDATYIRMAPGSLEQAIEQEAEAARECERERLLRLEESVMREYSTHRTSPGASSHHGDDQLLTLQQPQQKLSLGQDGIADDERRSGAQGLGGLEEVHDDDDPLRLRLTERLKLPVDHHKPPPAIKISLHLSKAANGADSGGAHPRGSVDAVEEATPEPHVLEAFTDEFLAKHPAPNSEQDQDQHQDSRISSVQPHQPIRAHVQLRSAVAKSNTNEAIIMAAAGKFKAKMMMMKSPGMKAKEKEEQEKKRQRRRDKSRPKRPKQKPLIFDDDPAVVHISNSTLDEPSSDEEYDDEEDGEEDEAEDGKDIDDANSGGVGCYGKVPIPSLECASGGTSETPLLNTTATAGSGSSPEDVPVRHSTHTKEAGECKVKGKSSHTVDDGNATAASDAATADGHDDDDDDDDDEAATPATAAEIEATHKPLASAVITAAIRREAAAIQQEIQHTLEAQSSIAGARTKPTQPKFKLDIVKENNNKLDDVVRSNAETIRQAFEEAVLRLRDPADKVYIRSASTSSTETELLIVRDALELKASKRVASVRQSIVQFLQAGCKLGPYLDGCSAEDLKALSDAAFLREVDPQTVRYDEPFAVRGESVLNGCVIVSGTVDVTVYEEIGEEEPIPTLPGAGGNDDEEEEEDAEDDDDDDYAVDEEGEGDEYTEESNKLHNKTQNGDGGSGSGSQGIVGGDYGKSPRQRTGSNLRQIRDPAKGPATVPPANPCAPIQARAQVPGLTTTAAPVRAKLYRTYTKRLFPGDIFGVDEVLRGSFCFSVDVRINPFFAHSSSSSTSSSATTAAPILLCSIPIESLLRYIGWRNDVSKSAMVLFWKHTRLWSIITEYNQELIKNSVLRHKGNTRKGIQADFRPLNVLDTACVRVYQTGEMIFNQDEPRHHLFVLLRGCCEYQRRFPPLVVDDGLMPEVVGLGEGTELMCGDFSFMDGEDHLWVERMAELDQQVAGSSEESDTVRAHRKKKYCRFERHKNSLIARTRVEIVTVPIFEIAKSIDLLYNLLKIATVKYPLTFTSSEDIVRKYYTELRWKIDRKKVMRTVAEEKISQALNQHMEPNPFNNLHVDLYNARKARIKASALNHFLTRVPGLAIPGVDFAVTSADTTAAATSGLAAGGNDGKGALVPAPPSSSRPSSAFNGPTTVGRPGRVRPGSGSTGSSRPGSSIAAGRPGLGSGSGPGSGTTARPARPSTAVATVPAAGSAHTRSPRARSVPVPPPAGSELSARQPQGNESSVNEAIDSSKRQLLLNKFSLYLGIDQPMGKRGNGSGGGGAGGGGVGGGGLARSPLPKHFDGNGNSNDSGNASRRAAFRRGVNVKSLAEMQQDREAGAEHRRQQQLLQEEEQNSRKPADRTVKFRHVSYSKNWSLKRNEPRQSANAGIRSKTSENSRKVTHPKTTQSTGQKPKKGDRGVSQPLSAGSSKEEGRGVGGSRAAHASKLPRTGEVEGEGVAPSAAFKAGVERGHGATDSDTESSSDSDSSQASAKAGGDSPGGRGGGSADPLAITSLSQSGSAKSKSDQPGVPPRNSNQLETIGTRAGPALGSGAGVGPNSLSPVGRARGGRRSATYEKIYNINDFFSAVSGSGRGGDGERGGGGGPAGAGALSPFSPIGKPGSKGQQLHSINCSKSADNDPEYYVQLYREKLKDDPRQRFVSEFINQAHFR